MRILMALMFVCLLTAAWERWSFRKIMRALPLICVVVKQGELKIKTGSGRGVRI
jgi:hypothetical protein